MSKQPDKAIYIKFARGVTWFAYGFAIVAVFFLILGFFLLLFGANYTTPFVQFIYKGATAFLQPFREIFPTHQISETSYFNASALFASLMYALFAMACHSFINFLTSKIEKYSPPEPEVTPAPAGKPARSKAYDAEE
jgi:uncharacterized protein YggT (Ycf19 family)